MDDRRLQMGVDLAALWRPLQQEMDETPRLLLLLLPWLFLLPFTDARWRLNHWPGIFYEC